MFLLVDKPQWCTSHDIVDKIRRVYGGEKVGHWWTLDPMATGLLIIAIGKETKQLDTFLGAEKTYRTTIDFSKSSDTWDMDYWKEMEQYEMSVEWEKICINNEWIDFPTQVQFETTLKDLIWTHPIPLTPFSARKIRGKKLYEYAREGNPIFMDVPMTVYQAELLAYSFPTVTCSFTVGSWTYIRSLGYWLGKQFGLWWVLTMLRRTAVNEFTVPE